MYTPTKNTREAQVAVPWAFFRPPTFTRRLKGLLAFMLSINLIGPANGLKASPAQLHTTVAASKDETVAEKMAFQRRAQSIIDITADHYLPPSLDIGDPEKYWWPKVMARLNKYGPQDTTAARIIPLFSKRPPFHFVLVGTARMLYQYADVPAMKKHRLTFIQSMWNRKDSYNAWTCEGTENHINMSRTSGYLFAQAALDYPAQFPDAKQRMAEMKTWMQQWSKRLYQVGNGEWNTGIYEAYHVVGWLNVFDFAKDPEVKAVARAVLDYYATEMALHYSYGVLGGAEMRSAGAGRGHATSAAWLGWLWFGEPVNRSLEHAKGSEFIQNMHAINSSYRPPHALVLLARKNGVGEGFYQESRPEYLLNKGSFSKHWFYAAKGFTLGAASIPYGGWMGGSMQMLNWKLVAQHTSSDSLPYEVSGNGRFYDHWDGKTRNPFTQVFQSGNTVVQLTKTPNNVSQIASAAITAAKTWDQRWRQDFNKRFPGERNRQTVIKPGKPQLFQNVSYLSFPQDANLVPLKKNGSTLAYGTQLGNALVVIYSVANKLPTFAYVHDRLVVKDSTVLGKQCGFVVRAFSLAQHGNLESLWQQEMDAVVETGLTSGKVRIKDGNQDIRVQFSDTGSTIEPIVDWGFGPAKPMALITAPPFQQPTTWPAGKGGGRMPQVWVNDNAVNLEANDWPVYRGPGLSLENGVLTVKLKPNHLQASEANGVALAEEFSYSVDYSASLPIFR